jgi:hypothetical protein
MIKKFRKIKGHFHFKSTSNKGGAGIPSITAFQAEVFAGSTEKSQQMAGFYSTIAAKHHCEFLDAGHYIVPSDIDGIHLDVE